MSYVTQRTILSGHFCEGVRFLRMCIPAPKLLIIRASCPKGVGDGCVQR